MSLIFNLLKVLAALVLILILIIAGALTFGPVANIKGMLGVAFGYTIDSPEQSTLEQRLKVPEGFSIGRYASNLGKIRFMAVASNGDLLVSKPHQGQVLILKADANQDDQHDGQAVLLQQLRRPHGLVLFKNWLYVAESNAIGRVPFDQQTGELTGDYQQIITELTDDGNHWTKSILIRGEHLYVSMGSTCNVCEENDKRRATIMRYNLDGSDGKIFATGLRNSVGLDSAPWSDDIFATDNGRDLLGDDYPPCELNKIEEDQFYGWPYINGFGDLDPDFGQDREALLKQSQSPVFGFAAHNAPLGIRFIRNAKVPADYQKTALVALHGSWNRTSTDGYKVVALHWQDDNTITSEDFLTGFDINGDIIGRPVDIAESADGCLFVSDDYSGTIYRVCYDRQQRSLSNAEDTTSTSGLELLEEAERKQLVAEGAALYKSNYCANCHNMKGQGNVAGKNLEQLSGRYQLSSLTEYFLTPNPPMPQFDLEHEQRRALAAYLLNQQPQEQRHGKQ